MEGWHIQDERVTARIWGNVFDVSGRCRPGGISRTVARSGIFTQPGLRAEIVHVRTRAHATVQVHVLLTISNCGRAGHPAKRFCHSLFICVRSSGRVFSHAFVPPSFCLRSAFVRQRPGPRGKFLGKIVRRFKCQRATDYGLNGHSRVITIMRRDPFDRQPEGKAGIVGQVIL